MNYNDKIHAANKAFNHALKVRELVLAIERVFQKDETAVDGGEYVWASPYKSLYDRAAYEKRHHGFDLETVLLDIPLEPECQALWDDRGARQDALAVIQEKIKSGEHCSPEYSCY